MSGIVDIVSYRDLPRGWQGVVFIVDVDRTYLATRFSSVAGIVRIPGEAFVDKQDLPGMTALLREIRRGPGGTSRETPLSFVSASPAQLRRTIERKLIFDGIGFDATVFKNWTRLIRGIRFKRFRNQFAFKVTALLTHRSGLPPRAHEILIGDDLEADPLAFAFYADLLAGRLSIDRAPVVLARFGVDQPLAREIVELRRALGIVEGRVEVGLIRMERTRDPTDFLPFRGRIAGCRNAAQIAAVLWVRGHISLDGVARVVGALGHRGHRRAGLIIDLRDAVARGLVSAKEGRALMARLRQDDSSSPIDLEIDPRWRDALATDPQDPWLPPRH